MEKEKGHLSALKILREMISNNRLILEHNRFSQKKKNALHFDALAKLEYTYCKRENQYLY